MLSGHLRLRGLGRAPCPSLPCFFENRHGKPPKKTRIFFSAYRTPKISGKKGKPLKKTKESSQGKKKTRNFLGSVFCAERIFRGFVLLTPPDFFRGFHRLFFCSWGKVPRKILQENPPRKSPAKILQNLYYKNPQHTSAEGPDQNFKRKGKKGPSGRIQVWKKGVFWKIF